MNYLKKSIMGKYNAEDVDKLLQKVRDDYELCLKNQKERLFKLRDENRELCIALEMYKNNERYISHAITHAEETAQAILQHAQLQAEQQIKQAEQDAQQFKNAAEGCYQRLMKLKQASESICTAVSYVLGDIKGNDKSNICQFTGVRDN